MMAGIAHAQVPASIGWSFVERIDDYELGQSSSLVAGVDNTAYWNDLRAPNGAQDAPYPSTPWTGFLNSAGTSISGTVQVTDASTNNFTGVDTWSAINNSTTGHDKMMGSGAMNYHNDSAAFFTISVRDLPQAYLDHEDGFWVRVYWGGVSSSSASDSGVDTVETVYTIGTSTGALTFGGSETDQNWETRDGSEYVLNGNYVELNLASLDTNGGFDLVVSRGGQDRRIGLSGFEIVAIPEPSTYAAIAGLLALGLVIWRRRKS